MSRKIYYLIFAILLLPAVLVGCSCSQQGNNSVTPSENINFEETNSLVEEDADLVAMKALDGVIYQLASTDGKVSGQMGLKFIKTDEEYQYLEAAVYLVIEEALPAKTPNLSHSSALGYFQVGHLTKQGEERDDDNGAISPRFCGKDVEISIMESFDDFMGLTDHLSECSQDLGVETAFMKPLFFTNHFHTIFSKYDYKDIESYNKYVIFDGSQYQIREDYEGLESYFTDLDKVIAEGSIIKEYTITYSK